MVRITIGRRDTAGQKKTAQNDGKDSHGRPPEHVLKRRLFRMPSGMRCIQPTYFLPQDGFEKRPFSCRPGISSARDRTVRRKRRRSVFILVPPRAPVAAVRMPRHRVRRRIVPPGRFIGRAPVMMRGRHAAGKGKRCAEPHHDAETKHTDSFSPDRYDRRNVAVARSPPSGRFSRITSPPCMRAMLRAMESPSPVPPVLRLRERSTR